MIFLTTTQASMEFLGMAKHHVRAATYARCSDTYEDEKTIASQTDVMKLYAEQCGYELNETHIYQEAITGYYNPSGSGRNLLSYWKLAAAMNLTY